MPSRGRDLDEDDVRVRPNKRKSRARTKIRPDFDSTSQGMVVTVDRGRFTVALDAEGSAAASPLTYVYAVKARELGRKGIVVGDVVELDGELSIEEGALHRIVRRHARRTSLHRSADDSQNIERVVVANADQLAVVVAAVDPEPRPRLIDRALVAAFDGGLDPLVIVTKTDLASASELRSMYQPLDVPFVETDPSNRTAALSVELANKVTVLMGHSGVGKSTLVNTLVPSAHRATGDVNAVTGRGRHTSTSALALALPLGGWIIDTPGIRSFGLGHVDIDRFMRAFPDLEVGARECPRGCTHDNEHCQLDNYVAAGQADPGRLSSLRRLLASRAGDDDTAPESYRAT